MNSTSVLHIALPEAWRVALLLRPEARGDVRKTLAAVEPGARLLDWGDPAPGEDDLLIAAALDLSTAELLLKLDPATRVIGVDNALEPRWPWGGRRALLARARSVPRCWVAPPGRPRDLPSDLGHYLQPALEVARDAWPRLAAG